MIKIHPKLEILNSLRISNTDIFKCLFCGNILVVNEYCSCDYRTKYYTSLNTIYTLILNYPKIPTFVFDWGFSNNYKELRLYSGGLGYGFQTFTLEDDFVIDNLERLKQKMDLILTFD